MVCDYFVSIVICFLGVVFHFSSHLYRGKLGLRKREMQHKRNNKEKKYVLSFRLRLISLSGGKAEMTRDQVGLETWRFITHLLLWLFSISSFLRPYSVR